MSIACAGAEVEALVYAHPFHAESEGFVLAPRADPGYERIPVEAATRDDLARRGINVQGALGRGNQVIVARGSTSMAVNLSFNGRAGCTIVLESDLHLNLTIACEADDGLFLIRGGWHKFTCRLRDPGCAVIVDRHCSIGGADIWVEGRNRSITIGEGCLLAWSIALRTGDSHAIVSIPERRVINPCANIAVARKVWIGYGAQILKGTRIGAGAIIGASSTVTKSVPPACLAVGSPAKVRRAGVTWTQSREPDDAEIDAAIALAR